MRTLEEMQMLEQAQNANQPQNAGQFAHPFQSQMPSIQSYGNPLDQGTMSGMRAARESIAGDEEQNRRAMGQAMMHVFSNMYKRRSSGEPMFGLGSLANSLNESVIPAVSAHNQAREHERMINLKMLQRQDDLNQSFRQEQLKREQLDETKRYNDAHLGQLMQKAKMQYGAKGIENVNNVSKLMEIGEAPANAVPLASLPKNVQLTYHKDMLEKANKGKFYNNVISTLDEMQKLSDEYPDLDTDFNQIFLDPENAKTKSAIALSKVGMSDKKSRAAIEKWTKLTSNLVTSKISGMSGKAVTDIMKKNIMEGVPRFGLTKEARDYNIKELRDEIEPKLEESRWSAKGIAGGYYVPPQIVDEVAKQQMINEESDVGGIDHFRRQYPESQNYSDEAIKLVIQRMKAQGQK